MISFPQVPVTDVRDVLIARHADRLEAAEKLIEQIIPALENGMIYQQDTKGYYGLYDQTRQALAAAKQFMEGK